MSFLSNGFILSLGTVLQRSCGYSCLHFAAGNDNVDLFSFIIENVKEKNPRANYKEFGITPLHLSAFRGKLEICKIIIENVVDLSCLDEKYRGQTPFEYARSNNQLEILDGIFC